MIREAQSISMIGTNHSRPSRTVIPTRMTCCRVDGVAHIAIRTGERDNLMGFQPVMQVHLGPDASARPATEQMAPMG
jgi:hypothetical protein